MNKPFAPSEYYKKHAWLAALNQRIRRCDKCRLSDTRTHAISGEGDPEGGLMLIALSPGSTEDKADRMFIGPSGPIINRLLATAGIDRKKVYMTNLIKCTLPKNRKPKSAEIKACSHFLAEEIAIIAPAVIVPLGYYATRAMLLKYRANHLATRTEATALYGVQILSQGQILFPLPHPSSLLYTPSFQEETQKKYNKLKTLIKE